MADLLSPSRSALKRLGSLCQVCAKHLDGTIAKRSLKESLAFLLCSIPTFIPDVRNFFGPYIYLVPIVAILSRVSGSVGHNIHNMISSTIGLGLGGVMGIIAYITSTRTANPPVLLTFWIGFSTFFFLLSKSLNTRNISAAGLANVIFIVLAMQYNYDEETFLRMSGTLVAACLVGVLLSTLVGILLLPTSAENIYQREFTNILHHLADAAHLAMADISLEVEPLEISNPTKAKMRKAKRSVHLQYFLIDDAADATSLEYHIKLHTNLLSAARKAHISMATALRNARYEFRGAFYFYEDYQDILNTINQMVQISNAIKCTAGKLVQHAYGPMPQNPLSPQFPLLPGEVVSTPAPSDTGEHISMAPLGSSSPSASATESDAIEYYLQIMAHPMRMLLEKLRTYCLAAGFDKSLSPEEFVKAKRELQAVMDELTEKQSLVFASLGSTVNLNDIHFKVFNLQELAQELLTLLEIVNLIRIKQRSLFKGLHLMIKDLFSFRSSPGSGLKIDVEEKTWRYRTWRVWRTINGIQYRFALKTAIAIASLSVLSFLDISASIFYFWRGLWALITVALVSSPTFGGNVVNSFARVCGTAIAALWSILTEILFHLNPFGYFFMLTMFVLPCSYLNLRGGTIGKIGVQGLSAICPICLGFFTTPSVPGLYSTIFEVSYKRALAISVGVMVSLFFGRVIWPYLARTELRRTLSLVFSELTLGYSSVMGTLDQRTIATLPVRSGATWVNNLKTLEATVQSQIFDCVELWETSIKEPRLKGRWQAPQYREIIKSAQELLDFHMCARIIVQRGLGSELRTELFLPGIKERRSYTVDLLTFFYLVSTTLSSKYALPYHLPPVSYSISKSIRKMNMVRSSLSLSPTDRCHVILLFAYAHNMTNVAATIEEMGRLLGALFGYNKYVMYGDDYRRLSTFS